MSKIVLALGGNALGNSPKEQLEIVKKTAIPIVDFIEEGNKVLIVHGNGPQIGLINLGMSIASEKNNSIPSFPFPECGAMSQGYIGYHLQNAIGEELRNRGINKSVSTIVTQVVVDKNDKAFSRPTKPIGNFYTKEEAEKIIKEKGYIMVEDSGRGYRRVVPSPEPIEIVEEEAIKTLFDYGNILIAAGGGGIPVIKEGNSLKGIDAVIDKDLAGEKIAEVIDADYFIILTAVDKVAINFRKPNQRNLDKIDIKEAKELIEENHFEPGSMLPKMLAAIKFVESKAGRTSIIGSLNNARETIYGAAGTIITR